MKTSIKFILILFKLNSLFFLYSCAATSEKNGNSAFNDSYFLKGQALVISKNYQQSIPFLKKSLEINDKNYPMTLVLLARAYDQLEEPEQAILTLTEYLDKQALFETNLEHEIIVRSLLFKNQTRININSNENKQKQALEKLILYSGLNSNLLLSSLNWGSDFNCVKYCTEEIIFLKNYQLYYLYLIDKVEDIGLYNIYIGLKEKILESSQYKKIQFQTLYDSLQTLHSFKLSGQIQKRTDSYNKLLKSLEPLENQLSQWSIK